MIRKTESENSHGMTEEFTMDSGKKVSNTVKGSTHIKVDIQEKVIGKLAED